MCHGYVATTAEMFPVRLFRFSGPASENCFGTDINKYKKGKEKCKNYLFLFCTLFNYDVTQAVTFASPLQGALSHP